MPCPLVTNADYPDYIKTVLKEINVGKDEEKKVCACQLRSPQTEEGCLILDEDQKVPLFPFCSTLVEGDPSGQVGENTDYPLKLTLKQAMDLYWKTKSWKFQAASSSNCSCFNYTWQDKKVEIYAPIEDKKERVCRVIIYLVASYKGNVCGSPNPDIGDYSIVGELFGTPTPMKHHKEGQEWFFYPYFQIYVSNYAVCGAQSYAASEECMVAAFGNEHFGTSNVPVKILGKEIKDPFVLHKSRWISISDMCPNFGDVSISKLEFNGS